MGKVLRAAWNASGERSRQVDNLTGLRSRNHSLEVGIFAALEFTFPPFSGALKATLFLVQLFLSTDPLSLTLFHAVFLSRRFELSARGPALD
jgi:hypothetical protein